MMEGENMRKILITAVLLLLTACATPTVATPTQAHTRNIGDQFAVWGFCKTEEAARILSDVVERENDTGYVDVMQSAVQCLDTRINIVRGARARGDNPKVINVTLVEYGWSIVRADGQEYEFWKAVDMTGNDYAWVWVDAISGQPV